MTDMNDDDEAIEITEEQLEEMVEDAIDVLALALPDDAGDEYWRTLREEVERRSRDMIAAVEAED